MYQSILTASRPDSILPADGFKKAAPFAELSVCNYRNDYSKNKNFDFVNALWNTKLEPYADDYFDPYYDACCIYSA